MVDIFLFVASIGFLISATYFWIRLGTLQVGLDQYNAQLIQARSTVIGLIKNEK